MVTLILKKNKTNGFKVQWKQHYALYYYILRYFQNPDPNTVDIFGEIFLMAFKMNNLV